MNGIEELDAVYIGEDCVDFRHGQECKVHRLKGNDRILGFFDRQGEEYAYPAKDFEIKE